MTKASAWIVRRTDPGKTMRLFCLSYAGGSAATYADWHATLDPEIEVCAIQLPGRGARFRDPSFKCMAELVEALAVEINKFDDLPCAFFGHSLGGMVAFELARSQARRGKMLPQHLFVSGCHAPRHRAPSKDMHLMDDAGLIARLREYKGTPPEILAHRELMELVLPTVRADFAVVETYCYEAGVPLAMPITVLAGKDDPYDGIEQIEGWQQETSGPCRIQWFDGDHFFLRPCQQEVIACINDDLAPKLKLRPQRYG
jgi:surfactin synthase thioesterase subunit